MIWVVYDSKRSWCQAGYMPSGWYQRCAGFERSPEGTEGEEVVGVRQCWSPEAAVAEEHPRSTSVPLPASSVSTHLCLCLQSAHFCILGDLHLLYKTIFLSHSVEINKTVTLGFKEEGKRRIKSYWQGRKAYHFRLDLKIDGRLMELILITPGYSLHNYLPLSLLLFFRESFLIT